MSVSKECGVHLYHRPRPLRIVDHHIHPLAMGGPDTPGNQVLVCDTGHYNIHRLLGDLIQSGKMRTGGSKTERQLALAGFDAWVAAGRPGTPVFELAEPGNVTHPH